MNIELEQVIKSWKEPVMIVWALHAKYKILTADEGFLCGEPGRANMMSSEVQMQ